MVAVRSLPLTYIPISVSHPVGAKGLSPLQQNSMSTRLVQALEKGGIAGHFKEHYA